MTKGRNERGVAMLAVLGLVLALLPLAAAICVHIHLDNLLQRNHLGAIQAFYAAEAGLAHALAEIRPSRSLQGLLRGADGVEGTADDGRFPFLSVRAAGLSYEVRVRSSGDRTVALRGIGRGPHQAVREVEVLVGPVEVPFTPGALYVEAPAVDLDLGAGFSISGVPAGAANRGRSAVAGIAVAGGETAELRLQPHANQVEGAGGSPSLIESESLRLSDYVADLQGRLDATVYDSEPAAAERLGAPAAPRLTVIGSGWHPAADAGGFGILVVRGDLEIDGNFDFGGQLIVAGKLSVADSARFVVDGALWLGSAATATITLRGDGAIRYNPAALQRAAEAFEGALPYSAQAIAWREQG